MSFVCCSVFVLLVLVLFIVIVIGGFRRYGVVVVIGWVGVWCRFEVVVKGVGGVWVVVGNCGWVLGGNVCGVVVMLLLIGDGGVRVVRNVR